MEVTLVITKSVEQNAETYFEKAKKAKRKIPGVKKTIEEQKQKLGVAQTKAEDAAAAKEKKIIRKKEWFEKFRWCYSSTGFLVVGGRDATTNEIMIKKHLDKNDRVFHAELPGSPFIVIKNPDHKEIDEETSMEAAIICASFSKSWKSGRTTAEVYWVTPEQVSKEAKSGEYLAKGSFMIYGKRTFITAKINLAVCNYQDRIMCGPVSAIAHHATRYLELVQGESKVSDTAKKIQKIIGGELDEIIRALPPDCTIKKEKK